MDAANLGTHRRQVSEPANPRAVGSPAALSRATHSFATTVLVNNIHCASCVTHIQEVLAAISISTSKVGISVISQEILVWHASSTDASVICQALSDAAFEVYSASTVDETGSIVYEANFPIRSEGWIDSAADVWRQTPPRKSRPKEEMSTAQRSIDKKHLDNCAACREETARHSLENREKHKNHASIYGQVEREGSSAIKLWPTAERQSQNSLGTAVHHTDPEKNPSNIDGAEDGATTTSNMDDRLKQTTYSLILSVGGMTCASCTGAIKHALEDLDYVKSADVDLLTNSARVEFSGDRSKADLIVRVVEDVGYDAEMFTCEASVSSHHDQSRLHAVSIYRATLSIAGMTCVACPNAITRGLWELPFMKSVNITLMTGGGEVTFEREENLEKIIEKIDDTGYDVSVVESGRVEPLQAPENHSRVASRTLQIKVDGMFCSHCPDRVVEVLQATFPSRIVVEKQPTLKDPVLRITYEPRTPGFSIRDIISCIDSSNDLFRTTIYHPPSMEDRSRAMQIHERNRMLKRLLLSFLAAIPTLLIGVVWMSIVPSSNQIRQFFEQPFGSGTATRAEWALFILATPVMFFAADVFHIRAVKEIRALWRKGSKVPILQRFYRFGSMNLLISAGTSVAYIASLGLLISDATTKGGVSDTSTYFDTVVFLTFFILIGRNLEAYSKSKTGDAVAMLGRLKPQDALLVKSSAAHEEASEKENTTTQPTKTETVNADLLEVGDVVIVPHGSSPPADGIIVSGLARFDESSLTGESRTVHKGRGETVFVGTINTGDPITIDITETGGTSMLDQIVSVVREGQTKRAPVERIADVLTGYFVPVITALAIMTFFVWFAIGQSGSLNPKYLDGQAGGWAFWSLEFAIAVFVVACPCGIGLAAPTALFVGGGLAAKHGILVRGGGEAFQEAGGLDAIVFDKTGTLTEGGTLKVTDHELLVSDPEATKHTWSIAQSLEEQSSHPIARAILELASTKSALTTTAELVKETPGLGVHGTFNFDSASDSHSILYEAALGSETLISKLEPPPTLSYFTAQILSRWKTQAKSVAILATRRMPAAPANQSEGASTDPPPWTVAALFATTDPVRPTARPTIQVLQARGIAVYMLSGDNTTTALAVGASLGIPAAHVFAGVLPTQKAEKIAWLQAYAPRRASQSPWRRALGLQNHANQPSTTTTTTSSTTLARRAKIGFVGDGINDIPALHAADVAVSLATGSPIAMSSSAFILLSPSLLAIPLLLDLSARVFTRIRFNFAWALGYNLCLVPVAAGVLFEVGGGGWRLGPVWASAAMALSSVSVVLSSLALRWEGGWWVCGGKKVGSGGEVSA
ncbi:hypothetical protein MMC34_004427 [Xylographa carneopallida]|nr:hypothetical protein [Xylographa carneopallida]